MGRWTGVVLVAGAIVLIDQWIKALVVGHLPVAASVPLIPGVSLTHVHNRGVAFGLFAGIPPYVTMAVALTLLATLFYNRGRWQSERAVGAGIALIAGGASGNMIDRLRLGYVVDFVDIGIGNLRFYTFNVADACISTAILLLVALAVFPGLSRLVDEPAHG